MARKINEQNERIKRKYLGYLKGPMRKNEATVIKAAEGILRFEASVGYTDFKKFRVEQATAFQDKLKREISKATKRPLSQSTIASVLAANKGFIFWLASQTGYKSRVKHSDADYFNMDAKGQRVASTVREAPYPSLEMCRHTFDHMPEATDIECRNKAIFAFLMITGARDGAISSLRLKHINMIDGCVYQDARDVRTKASKTITTFFLPVDLVYSDFFAAWVEFLRTNELFGPDDPLFPPPEMGVVDGGFQIVGLKREPYKNANAIRALIKDAFIRAGLPPHTPHSFRKTLVKWGDREYPSREAFKAFSQNIGHSREVTTVGSYCYVSTERQGELIKEPRGI